MYAEKISRSRLVSEESDEMRCGCGNGDTPKALSKQAMDRRSSSCGPLLLCIFTRAVSSLLCFFASVV